MKFYILSVLGTLAATVAAVTNLTTILAETPSCTLNCLVEILPTTGCTVVDLAPCMCTNITIQAALSECVLKRCNIIDQAKSSVESQTMCAGYPQQSRGRETLTISMTFFAFTAIFVLLRLLSRQLVTKKLFMDDYAAITAFGFVVVSVILGLVFHGKGFGNHIWNISYKREKPLLKVWYVAQQIYVQTQTWGRVSLVLLYLRLFPNRDFQRFCYVTLAFLACQSISFTLVLLFQCTPVQSFWDLSIPGHCIHETAVAYAAAGITIVQDVIFLLMPLSQLKSLQVSKTQKMSLMGLFGVGIFATLTSIIRLAYLSRFSHSFDITWDNASVLEWGTIETDTMLICSCLPAVRPLYVRYMPNVYKFTQRNVTQPLGSNISRIWPSAAQPTANSWVELKGKKEQGSSDEKEISIIAVSDGVSQPAKLEYPKHCLSRSDKLGQDTSILITQVHDVEDEISDLKRNLETDV